MLRCLVVKYIPNKYYTNNSNLDLNILNQGN